MHPPRPRLVLNVGITGHRANAIGGGITAELGEEIDQILHSLSNAVRSLHEEQSEFFWPGGPGYRFHTALATGADQIAARSARRCEYEVRAVLPFSEAEYSRDFASGEEHREFKRHVDLADEVFCLPGKRSHEEDAYVLVGKAVIAAADILIAVWDGGEARGPGGTAHVVELALKAGVPVIHVGVDRDNDRISGTRLLTGGEAFDPDVAPLDGPKAYFDLLRETLAPHSAFERGHLTEYFEEIEYRRNWRIEYPILLAMLGVRAWPKTPWRQGPVRDPGERATGSSPELRAERLAEAYDWANHLAIHYAQYFRSGHVTNYALAALAVIVALTGLLVPTIKIYLVMVELGVIGLLFYNTHRGSQGEWHRKWLQYRHLAESLRPLAYLKRTGLAGPPFRSDFTEQSVRGAQVADWTRWYASAIWRQMNAPVGTMNDERIRGLAKDVLAEQVEPQAAYHEVNSKRMLKLDHRLHEVGNFLVGGVIAACSLYIVAYFALHEWVKPLTAPFVFVTAGFPALSAAAFGLRGHGEHLLASSRSASTVGALNVNGERLREIDELDDLTEELRTTAEIMLADLNEWAVAYRERQLQVPG